MLCVGLVDTKHMKEMSYPPTHNEGRDFISLFFSFSSSPGLAIVMKLFCTGLISKSPCLFSVCACGWIP